MCGIAGIIGDRGTRDALDRMVEALRHRGPDSGGVSHKGPVLLGARRLRILDLQAGDQPLKNEKGTVTVLLNGELYNHLALRAELERAFYGNARA